MLDRIKAWIAQQLGKARAWWTRQWPQVSTRAGLILTTASTIGPQAAQQLAPVSQQVANACAAVGGIAGLALVIWDQSKKGQANGQ